MLFAFMAIFSILFATLIFNFESGWYDPVRQQYVRVDGSTSPFESIPASIWWTIVTMTTVGYGDQVPVTVAGKVVAVITMFCGLVVLSLPITIIGANFDEEYRLLKKAKQDEIERKRQARKEAATPATKLADSAGSQQGGMTAVVKGLSPVSKVCTHACSCVPSLVTLLLLYGVTRCGDRRAPSRTQSS
jgi:low affinity Fe/Cu permease